MSRREELANFEVTARPRKKSAASKTTGGAAKKRSTARPSANSGAAKKTGASASKKSASARKPASGAKSAARKPASGRGKTAARGTSRASSASKQGMKTQNQARKKRPSIQENPVAYRDSALFYVENDRPPRRAERSDRSRRKKGGRRRGRGFSGLTVVLLIAILALAGVGAWRVREYRAMQNMKAVVSRQTFYAGTTVEGVDVSRMTLQQAMEHWESQIEPAYRQAAATLNDGTRVTAEELGYDSNYADVLSGAWSAGRSGSLVERYRRMAASVARPTAYEVSRTIYDDARVRDYAAALAEQIDAEPRDARVKSFNVETYSFEFEAESSGRRLNQAALVRDVEAALNAGGGSVQMDVEVIAPAVTQENVAAQYGMITYATTNASSSSSNRLSNISLALSMLNGVSLEPGESFSFNETVGQRTTERGFKKATAYSSGKVTEEVGGGICQVSTTLFNAAVKADLKIDERHNHSLTVSYVDLGKDAAVDWGNKDLRFTNTSSDRVYICAFLTDDKRVRVGVFGRLLADGVSITLEGVETGTTDFETQYQLSFELASGQTRVVQKGKKGHTAVAYKIWWDAQGNEIRRSEFCKSRYQATPEIVEYGP